ncbi:MAG: endolytic transglycosylase MltG [Patescibacteria group bacterium]|jgi:UPF0755 protein
MKKALIVIVLLIILCAGVGVAAYFIGIAMPSKNQEESLIVIKEGDGVDNVANQLKEKKIIPSAFLFKVYLFINNRVNKIQPGEYRFKQTNLQKAADELTKPGLAKNELSVTLLEGFTGEDMAAVLEEYGLVFKDDFISLINSTDTRIFLPDNKYEFLADKPITANLEGYLFPDTYRLYEDASAAEIIDKMLVNFGTKITEDMKQELAGQELTIYEAVTLASIVEKEAQTKQDKKIIAGVFLNRLSMGKKLESDATVNYVTGKQTTQPTYSDLAQDNLYNTYIYSGLPPGPICNPGLDSIEAVIYPEQTNYIYFLNTPSGNVIYSETGEEHIANKNKYYPD